MKLLKRCKELGDKGICAWKMLGLVALVLFSTMLIASVYNSPDPIKDIVPVPPSVDSTDTWIPTKEDLAYQDSMFLIVDQTSRDLDTIRKDIDLIIIKLDRLEYKDGSYDSIRYVKGSKIDKQLNQ